jgi:hypothetical protein
MTSGFSISFRHFRATSQMPLIAKRAPIYPDSRGLWPRVRSQPSKSPQIGARLELMALGGAFFISGATVYPPLTASLICGMPFAPSKQPVASIYIRAREIENLPAAGGQLPVLDLGPKTRPTTTLLHPPLTSSFDRMLESCREVIICVYTGACSISGGVQNHLLSAELMSRQRHGGHKPEKKTPAATGGAAGDGGI